MNKYTEELKRRLLLSIEKLKSSPEKFFNNPSKDFTRNRKLSLKDVVMQLIAMGGNSICKELLEWTGYAPDTATTSAFIQQREKILPYALEFMFREFTENHSEMKKFRNYRLFAIDGSVLNVAPSNADDGTYIPQVAESGYYALHLNAMYDLLNRIYVDAIIQPGKENDEKRAMADMIDRSDITEKVIITADRGYESYNIFAHTEQKGWNYLIRVKDLGSTGILSALSLPDSDEFDVWVNRIRTRKQTNKVKANPDVYRYIASTTAFDYLPKHTRKHLNEFYPISFRVVRFKVLDNLYETVITNLDSSLFSPDDLKELYIMRWGIETSFRKLKYTVGLTCFHSKKRDFIKQEIFARLIMYNFAEMVTSHVIISQVDRKLIYQVNFTVAVHVCKRCLRPSKNEIPINAEALIRKHILPVRPGRKDKRCLRSKSAVSFLYRVA